MSSYSNTVTLTLVSLFGLLLVLTSVSCIFCSSLHNIWCWRRSRKLLGNKTMNHGFSPCDHSLHPLQTSGRCPGLSRAPPPWTPGPWSPQPHATHSCPAPRVQALWRPRVKLRCQLQVLRTVDTDSLSGHSRASRQ